MNKNNEILIINFKFPPFPGIGGRRWLFFANHLVKKGFNVHVIAAKNPYKAKSIWANDINQNIKVTYLPTQYDTLFFNDVKTLKDKLLYRFNKNFLHLTKNGTIYDNAIGWKKSMLKLATRIIKKNDIKNVIVTGAPFRLLYYAIGLKKFELNINLIVDFRDQWIESDACGMPSLKKNRLLFEKKMELAVITCADTIITPCNSITNLLKGKYNNYSSKIKTISHAYNENYYSEFLMQKSSNTKVINILYGGSMEYAGLTPMFNAFLIALKKIELYHKSDFKKLKFTFYTQTIGYKETIKKFNLNETVFFKDIIPHDNFINIASTFDFLLMLNPNAENEFNTKFYDYLPLKRPIIVFADDGDLGKYVINNKIGFHARPRSFYEDIMHIIRQYKDNKQLFNENFDISRFSYDIITDKLINLFK